MTVFFHGLCCVIAELLQSDCFWSADCDPPQILFAIFLKCIEL